MPTVHLLDLARSPIGRLDGALARWHPVDLLADVLTQLLERARVDAAEVEELFAACVTPAGAQGANLARAAAITAGWDTVPGVTVDDGAAGGHRAFALGTDRILAGADVVVVAGVELPSLVPAGAVGLADKFGRPWGRRFTERFAESGGVPAPVETAAGAGDRHGIAPAAEEAWAAEARSRARAAVDPTIVPVAQGRDRVTGDDPVPEPAAGTDLIDPLDPVRRPVVAPPADGAAAAVLVSDRWLAARGRPGRARVGHTRHLARRPFGDALPLTDALGPDTARLDAVELDDRWAAPCLATMSALGLEPGRVNPGGGTLGRGDVGGASFLVRLGSLLASVPGPATVAVASADDLGGAIATTLTVDGPDAPTRS